MLFLEINKLEQQRRTCNSEINPPYGVIESLAEKQEDNRLLISETFYKLAEKENISSEQWLKIRNKNYSDSNSREIILCKQNTYITSTTTNT